MFNEGSGDKVFDLRRNRNHGTLMNGILWIPGETGQTLQFDGSDDHIDLGERDFTNYFTLSAWIKPNDVSQIEAVISITTSGGTSDGFNLFINTFNTNDRKVAFETGNGVSGNTAWTGINAITFGVWNHVIIVVERPLGIATIYVDAIDVTVDSSIRTDFKTSNEWRIGTLNSSDFPFSGSIDGIRVYNRILSANEIAWLYREPYAMFEPAFDINLYYAVAIGAVAPTGVLYGPLVGPFGGPI